MKVAVFGRTRFLYDTIDYLKDNGHEVVVIGTCKAAPEYDVKKEDFEKKAKELQVPFFYGMNLSVPFTLNILKSSGAEIAVSMNWLSIIEEEVLSIFKYGILNAHCGDLPRYRGNACPNWAILKGEKKFAITIHFMQKELDAGDIVLKKYYPIEEATNITDFYKTAGREIPKLFCQAIESIQNGNKGYPQSKNPKEALRCYPRVPSDSIIDWNWPCEEIVKVVRASASPFEGAYTFYKDIKIHIMDCTIKEYESPCYVYPGQVIAIDKCSGMVEVAASDGAIVIHEVVVDGKKRKAADILRSTRIRMNYCLQEELYSLRKKVNLLEKQLEEVLKKNITKS